MAEAVQNPEVVEETTLDRKQWLEDRRRGIGSSDAAGILGVSPWATPLSVWADKVGLSVDVAMDEEPERLRWGTLLEPVILAEYGRRRGVDVEAHPQDQVVAHDDLSTHMACTPDGYQVDVERELVEVKTTSQYMADKWADGPPLHYQVQVQHQMACTGLSRATIVVLIGGQEMRWFDVERNDRFIATLEKACRDFWERYVVTGEQPPASDSVIDLDVLVRLHPDDNGETVELPGEAQVWDSRLADIKAGLKALQEEKKELEGKIKAAIGAATFGALPEGGRYSWKTQERKEHMVKASKSRVLRRLKK